MQLLSATSCWQRWYNGTKEVFLRGIGVRSQNSGIRRKDEIIPKAFEEIRVCEEFPSILIFLTKDSGLGLSKP
jgi:hypothetical protein